MTTRFINHPAKGAKSSVLPGVNYSHVESRRAAAAAAASGASENKRASIAQLPRHCSLPPLFLVSSIVSHSRRISKENRGKAKFMLGEISFENYDKDLHMFFNDFLNNVTFV